MIGWMGSVKQSVVKVGKGRGFVLETRFLNLERVIITAAHCLPELPPAHAWSYVHERTYPNLVGSVDGEPEICAECLFVDPVGDIAVLGEPDGQVLFDQCEAYDDFIDELPALRIGKLHVSTEVWILSLSGKWLQCKAMAQTERGRFSLSEVSGDGIESGMSGSPIVSNSGEAIGVVVTGGRDGGGPQPNLNGNLPGAMLTLIEP